MIWEVSVGKTYYIKYSSLYSIQAERSDEGIYYFTDSPLPKKIKLAEKGNVRVSGDELANCTFEVKYCGNGIFEEKNTKIRMTIWQMNSIYRDKINEPFGNINPNIRTSADFNSPFNGPNSIENYSNFTYGVRYHQKMPLRVSPSGISNLPDNVPYFDKETRNAILKQAEIIARDNINYSVQHLIEEDYDVAMLQEANREEIKKEYLDSNKENETIRKNLEELIGKKVPENFQEYIDAHIDLDVALVPIEKLKIDKVVPEIIYNSIVSMKRTSSVSTIHSNSEANLYIDNIREIKYLGDLLLYDKKTLKAITRNKKNINGLIDYVQSLGCDFLEEKIYPTKNEDPNLLENCLKIDKNARVIPVLTRNNIVTRQQLEEIGPAVLYLVGMTDLKRQALKDAMVASGISFKTGDMKIDPEKFSVLPTKEDIDKIIEENAVIRARITMKEKLMKDYNYLLNERIQLLAHEKELDSKLSEKESTNSESEGKTR